MAFPSASPRPPSACLGALRRASRGLGVQRLECQAGLTQRSPLQPHDLGLSFACPSPKALGASPPGATSWGAQHPRVPTGCLSHLLIPEHPDGPKPVSHASRGTSAGPPSQFPESLGSLPSLGAGLQQLRPQASTSSGTQGARGEHNPAAWATTQIHPASAINKPVQEKQHYAKFPAQCSLQTAK